MLRSLVRMICLRTETRMTPTLVWVSTNIDGVDEAVAFRFVPCLPNAVTRAGARFEIRFVGYYSCARIDKYMKHQLGRACFVRFLCLS